MGTMGLLIVIIGNGSVSQLIVLYSINVFITFSMSQLGMSLYWWRQRATENKWKPKLFVNALGFMITFFILTVLCIIKFAEGGWLTLLFTGFIISCAL
jgi:K+ transporter